MIQCYLFSLFHVLLYLSIQAHGWQYLVQCSKQGLEELHVTASPELYSVLRRVVVFFSLYAIESNSGNFLEVREVVKQSI